MLTFPSKWVAYGECMVFVWMGVDVRGRIRAYVTYKIKEVGTSH